MLGKVLFNLEVVTAPEVLSQTVSVPQDALFADQTRMECLVLWGEEWAMLFGILRSLHVVVGFDVASESFDNVVLEGTQRADIGAFLRPLCESGLKFDMVIFFFCF